MGISGFGILGKEIEGLGMLGIEKDVLGILGIEIEGFGILGIEIEGFGILGILIGGVHQRFCLMPCSEDAASSNPPDSSGYFSVADAADVGVPANIRVRINAEIVIFMIGEAFFKVRIPGIVKFSEGYKLKYGQVIS